MENGCTSGVSIYNKWFDITVNLYIYIIVICCFNSQEPSCELISPTKFVLLISSAYLVEGKNNIQLNLKANMIVLYMYSFIAWKKPKIQTWKILNSLWWGKLRHLCTLLGYLLLLKSSNPRPRMFFVKHICNMVTPCEPCACDTRHVHVWLMVIYLMTNKMKLLLYKSANYLP